VRLTQPAPDVFEPYAAANGILAVVDAQEFFASDVGKAFNVYLDSSNGILELTGAIYRTFDAVSKNSGLQSVRAPLASFADQTFNVIQQNKVESYPLLHSLVLTGSWAAFETMVVDICKAILRLARASSPRF
jgi:hypothetical protein